MVLQAMASAHYSPAGDYFLLSLIVFMKTLATHDSTCCRTKVRFPFPYSALVSPRAITRPQAPQPVRDSKDCSAEMVRTANQDLLHAGGNPSAQRGFGQAVALENDAGKISRATQQSWDEEGVIKIADPWNLQNHYRLQKKRRRHCDVVSRSATLAPAARSSS